MKLQLQPAHSPPMRSAIGALKRASMLLVCWEKEGEKICDLHHVITTHLVKSSQVKRDPATESENVPCPTLRLHVCLRATILRAPGPSQPVPSALADGCIISRVVRTQPPDRRNSQVPMHDQHAPRACTALTTLPYDTPSFSRHVEHAGQVSRHVEHGDLRSIAIPAACHASRRATIPCHRRRARSHPTCDTPACLCVSVRLWMPNTTPAGAVGASQCHVKGVLE